MTTDEIDCIEEGGTEATIPLLRRLAAALDAGVASLQATTSAPSASNPAPPDHLTSQFIPAPADQSSTHRFLTTERHEPPLAAKPGEDK